MIKRFRYIILLAIMLSGALQALAQVAMPDNVCVGTNRRYWVTQGMPGSIFTWKLNGVMQSSTVDFIVVTLNNAGVYTLEVQEHQPNCDGDIQSGIINVIDFPNLVITHPAAICQPETVDLSAAAITAGSDPNLTFSYWTDAGATTTLTTYTAVSISGTYYIKATNTTGCSTIKSVNVIINPLPKLVVTNPAEVCEPTTVDLSAASITSGSDAGLILSYWADGTASTTVSNFKAIAVSGTYYIKATNPVTGCYSIKPVEVIINPLPHLVIHDPDEVCEPATINLSAASVTSGSDVGLTLSYWTNATATAALANYTAVSTTGTYYIKATTNKGCSVILPVHTLVYKQPLAFAGKNATICPESPYTILDATTQNAGSVQWTSTGDGYFDDPTLLHSSYIPGPADNLSGKLTLTLTAQGMGKGTCTPAVSSLTLTILKLQAIVDKTDITCYGANNGEISIIEQSGGNYEYNIGKGWKTTADFTNLLPGSYTVQMRDPLFPVCVKTLETVTIIEPEPLTASVKYTDATCQGNDGTISVIDPKGGSGGYEFSINGKAWTTSGYFVGLIPGVYEVWISDANVLNCTKKLGSVVISVPIPVTATVDQTNVTCYGGNDGKITISDPKNGSGIYQYSIDGISWQSGLVFNNLFAGTYNVKMRDQKAITCIETIATINLTEPNQLQAAADRTNVTCYGAKDGTITISNPSGGSGLFEFTIDGLNWSNKLVYTNLAPHTYPVLMRDKNNPKCSAPIANIVITEPPQLTADVNSTDISCFGSKDGTILITNPQHGLPNYGYSISGSTWQGSGTFADLGPNSYIVKMRDANGCTMALDTVKIIEPKPLTAIVEHTDVTCLGNDGTITLSKPENSVSGLYEYSINGTTWTSTTSFTALVTNNYPVWIRDANLLSCQLKLTTAEVSGPEPLHATAQKTDVTCYGANDGTITILNPAGGSSLFEYTVDGITWTSTTTLSNLAPAAYVLQMRDAKAIGCSIIVQNITITQPTQLQAIAVPTHVTCYEGNDGEINMTNELGGSGKYEYSLNGTIWVTNKLNKLKAGIYTVMMRDAATPKCMVSLAQVEIKQPEKLSATVTPSPVTCFGGNDGSITISNPKNGVGPYMYSLDGGATWTSNVTFNGLIAKNYTLLVIKDANSCSQKLDFVVVTQPEKLAASYQTTNETIDGAKDGTITIIGMTGGSGDYEFSSDNINWQLSSYFTGLVPGSYTILMRDAHAHGCMIPIIIKVLPAGSLSATPKVLDVTCYGGIDGSIIFENSSGAKNYEYSIYPNIWQSSATFNGLTAKSYNLEMRDANNKSNSAVIGSVEVRQPAPLSAVVNTKGETFAGAGDGSITIISPNGGSGAFEYNVTGSWESNMVYTGLVSGTYNVQIRDKNMPTCFISYPKILSPLGTLTADVSSVSVSCFGSNDGSITVKNPLGGSNVYDYSINAGSTWQSSGTFSLLAKGTYDVWIRDAGNIANKASLGKVSISEPTKLTASFTNYVAPLCAGGSGSFTITGIGGTPPYIGEGDYTVSAGTSMIITVIDKNGCSVEIPVNMPNPEKIVAVAVVSPPKCIGDNGTVTISATGGTGIYKGIGTFAIAGGKPYGPYKVTDSNGCSSNIISGIMPSATKIVVTAKPVPSLCLGGNITVNVTATGGTGIYNGVGNFVASLGAHTYDVTDSNGCMASTTINITSVDPPAAPTATANSPCVNGTLTLGGAPDGLSTYTWTGPNSYFSNTQTSTIANVTPSAQGDYSLTITNSGGCYASTTITVTINPIPIPVAKANPVCENETLTLSGAPDGMAKYSWIGPNGFTSTEQNPQILNTPLAAAGTYTLTATNNGDCPASTSVNAIVYPSLVLKVTANNPCENGVLVFSGAPAGMNKYEWTGPNGFKSALQNPTISAVSLLASGTYSLTVTNVNGCTSSSTVKVTINQLPIVSASQISPTCAVPSGSIVVTNPVGINYRYNIDGGAYTTTATFANLVPGSTHRVNAQNIITGCISLDVAPIKINPMPALPSAPVAKVTTKPTCNNPDGTVEVTSPLGSDLVYTMNGKTQTSTIFTNIKTGTYTITVRDTKTTCTSGLGSVIVPAIPPSPVLTKISQKNPTCFGDQGTITFYSSNTPNGVYTMKYTGGQFNSVTVVNGTTTVTASAGTYNNIFIEVNGCKSDEIINVVITVPNEIVIDYKITEVELKTPNNGAINITVSGGTPKYTYKWSNGATTEDINNLSPGNYTVWVTDTNSCTVTKSFIIPQPNYPPVAKNDEFAASCSGVIGNLYVDNGKGEDYDPESDPFFVQLTLVEAPKHGKVTINPDQSGAFVYSVDPGYAGDDSFQYVLYDIHNGKQYVSDPAIVTIHVISDFDFDGIADVSDPDADGDGILNINEGLATADSDGDGHPNWLDIDSDNDGIVDNIEAQNSLGYIMPKGIDADHDGIDDAYDTTEGGTVIMPIDTDADGVPDFLDSDSDNDLVPDYIEGHDVNADGKIDSGHEISGKDADADGLDNAYDTVENKCENASENMIGSNAPRQDFDGDGMRDWRDDNDDNDEYLTRFEDLNMDGDFSNDDTDFDGHPEYLDFGRDCDLFVPDAFSPNDDNVHDYFQIYCIDHYPNAKMFIFDQMGNKLYEQDNYGNIDKWGTAERAWWDGRTNNRSVETINGKVTPGTYYYVLKLGNGEVRKSFVFVSY